MSTLTPATTGTPALRAMAAIETRRLARHPAFLLGVVATFGLVALMYTVYDNPDMTDLLATPFLPAFFIGLTSLVATARLTRSTEAAAESLGTAPGTESRRTAALLIACLLPFGAGLLFVAVILAMAAARGVHPHEWWFTTMPDWQVWSILLALSPVACLGGAVLGVLTGRWLRFPGAAAVMVVALVVVTMVGQVPIAYESYSELRLWVPWAMFHSGAETDGTAYIYAGNPAFYLGYVLCLCAGAALMALWHDRAARTRRLRAAIAAVTVVGLACLALAMTTGNADNLRSEPIPYQIDV